MTDNPILPLTRWHAFYSVEGARDYHLWIPAPPSGIPVDVCYLYEKLTFYLISKTIDRYSSDAILHQIRWHFHVEWGQREFKCNDNWTPDLARWFLARHPEHEGFFELRMLKRRRGEETSDAPDKVEV